MSQTSYVKTAIALPVSGHYTYSVPEQLRLLVLAGKRVLVPFGRRRVTGYVLGFCEKPAGFKTRHILDVLDDCPLFPPSMVPFFEWTAAYYKFSMGEAIRTALPGGINVYDVRTAFITEAGNELKTAGGCGIEQKILSILSESPCPVRGIGKKIGIDFPDSVIHSLAARNLITIENKLKKVPSGVKMERYVSIIDPTRSTGKMSAKRQAVLGMVKDHKHISLAGLKERFPTAPRLVKLLEKDGFISIEEKEMYRDPFGDPIEPDTPPELSEDQNRVVSDVLGSLGKGYRSWLLAGVTGSGKTEVYMRIAMEVLDKGLTALVLVPEISLISQTERRFRARFGERVAVLHSGLTSGQRYDQWMRIARGEADIAIGARSAIFAPLENIGIIIVDEEHDTSYKQDHGLHYNARDIAVVRAKQLGAVCLFGSATPSVQSYFNALSGKFSLTELKKRVNQQAMPHIDVVDLRKLKESKGIERYISSELFTRMQETLGRGEQILLFLNRRGFANFPVCSACGEPIKCRDCDVTLTLHKGMNAYRCHFCGFSMPAASRCPACHSSDIILLGMGTEKVEEAVSGMFPQARVARLDHDTTTKKGAMLKTLKGVRQRTIDIVVGTQMVAKGHDFPNITLVGIICADLSLNFPDFRAGERTFQLLAQVAGRAGRGDRPGRVVMQTYSPDHFSIVAAKNQDFLEFYSREIIFRQGLSYPPFSRIVQLKISGKNENETRHYAGVVGARCSSIQRGRKDFNCVMVMGPIEASIPRVAGRFRWQILLKSENTSALHDFTGKLMFDPRAKLGTKGVRVVVDVDPFFMM